MRVRSLLSYLRCPTNQVVSPVAKSRVVGSDLPLLSFPESKGSLRLWDLHKLSSSSSRMEPNSSPVVGVFVKLRSVESRDSPAFKPKTSEVPFRSGEKLILCPSDSESEELSANLRVGSLYSEKLRPESTE